MFPLLLTGYVLAGQSASSALESPVTGVVGIASGWGIVGILVLMLFRGDIATKREVNAFEKTIDYQRQTIETNQETIAAFTREFSTSNAMIQAVLDVAKDATSKRGPS